MSWKVTRCARCGEPIAIPSDWRHFKRELDENHRAVVGFPSGMPGK